MSTWLRQARERLLDQGQEGQTLTEYGLIMALVVVVVIAVLALLGPKIRDIFQNVVDHL
jgi:Flp pilus assembly pilin Flp